MDALSTASDVLADRPVLRAGLAAVAAVGLVVTPFEAMDAVSAASSSKHVEGYNEPCIDGCDTVDEICCNDPIG